MPPKCIEKACAARRMGRRISKTAAASSHHLLPDGALARTQHLPGVVDRSGAALSLALVRKDAVADWFWASLKSASADGGA